MRYLNLYHRDTCIIGIHTWDHVFETVFKVINLQYEKQGPQTRALWNNTLSVAFAKTGSIKVAELLPIGQVSSEPVM